MRFLLLMFFAVSSPVLAQEANPLVGTWKLISSESIVENEAPQPTFGLHPKGYLIITREGRLMIIMTADDRKAGMSDAERAALHKTMAAVSGKVRVEGTDFIISVDVSWNESWNGTEQRRHFKIEGDKLFVDTAPGPSLLFPGKTSFGRLVFERDMGP
jgi:Lipocalin-like domain